jgi:hypothetical protein
MGTAMPAAGFSPKRFVLQVNEKVSPMRRYFPHAVQVANKHRVSLVHRFTGCDKSEP